MPLRFATKSREAYDFPLIIRQLWNGVLAKAGTQRIIYRDRVDMSYHDLSDRITRLASLLHTIGVSEGQTVAVMDWDSHRYLEAFFAVPMMGAVLQTVNVRLPTAQIAFTLDHAQAEVLIVHRDFYPMVEEILAALPLVRAVIAIADDDAEPVPPWAIGEYETLLATAPTAFDFQDLDENAVATTFYTSGTTGNPKGVCFTHRQIVLHTLATCGPFGASQTSPSIGSGDVYMPLTPMFHVHAWGFPYVATMLGLKQVYPGRFEPDMVCNLRKTHEVTYSHGVPTILQMILAAADRTKTDLAGWKLTVGGSALSAPLHAQASARGMLVGMAYGMSEACPIITTAAHRETQGSDSTEKLQASMTVAGLSVPLVDVRIVDDKMNPLPHDGETRGELVVRAPWLTRCYVGDLDASTALWRGGWMHTQDVATIDAQGSVRIRDRLKDVVKTGGEWVDSIHLEELVALADCVSEAAVVAIPDEKWGERPLAVIVPVEGESPTLTSINAAVLRAIAAGEISNYAKLSRFEIVDALPRTSVGKIDKKLIRARFAGPV